MKYRKFGRLDWKVSVLGFGAMRLPVIGGDPAAVNVEEAVKMIRYAIDHGVNYIDTAYPYHHGNSEIVVGKALKDGYREKVKVATKMPTWMVKSHQDMDRILDEQLKRLQTDYIDFYLLHGLNRERWRSLLSLDVFKWAEKTIREGKIVHLGFSFHDDYEVLKEIIDGYQGWTLCQIQYNYMDADYQAGTRGLKYAASKGLAVVVMEPIAGGLLSLNPPREVQALWDQADIKRTPAEWALQWVWNHPEVSVALSGMSTIEQVIENIESADRSGPGTLTAEELELISKVRQKYLEYGFIGCTGCQYCMPCPNNVEIPKILKFYNESTKVRNNMAEIERVIKEYLQNVPSENGANNCIKCGRCEELCPQHLPIRRILEEASRIFERR